MPETIIEEVRVYIDGIDVTYFLFGKSSIDITTEDNTWRNLDISQYVKYLGYHTIIITCGRYQNGRAEVRTEIF